MKNLTYRIHPSFFIMSALISLLLSWSSGFSWGSFILWMVIIFLSVVVHELGHALTAIGFGQQAHIELTPFGGVTIPSGKKLSRGKEFLVILAGPLFGLSVYLGALLLTYLPYQNPMWLRFLTQVQYVNLFWTVVNLLPILPLDGGQLMRNLLEHFFGFRAFRISLLCSMVFSIILGILSFVLLQNILLAAIFLFFAFQSFEAYRRLRFMSPVDQDANVHKKLQEIEQAVKTGHVDDGIGKLYQLREQIHEGLIYNAATELLAKLLYKQKNFQEIYNILDPISKNISPEGKFYLLCSAFEVGDFTKVIDLSPECFRRTRDAKVASYTAQSHAMLKDESNAINWLRTLQELDGTTFRSILQNEAFDSIRDTEAFQKLIQTEQT